MKMSAKASCEECGKEFEQRNSVGGIRKYCSLKCRTAHNNRKFRNKKAKELGTTYWSWRWRNDPAFKEKQSEYSRKYYRLFRKSRHGKEKEKE